MKGGVPRPSIRSAALLMPMMEDFKSVGESRYQKLN